jgi:polyferredoxin
MNRRLFNLVFSLLFLAMGGGAFGEEVYRFPPPEFESNYQMPGITTPAPRALLLQYADVAVLAGALGLASYLVLKQRSRKHLVALSLFSLAYFGFYRKGCVCAIGSVQNVTLALFDSSYALPASVALFFLAPLVTALFAGRTFCAGVCPHGALQDVVLLKPVKVPPALEAALGVLPYIYLGAGVLFAATGSAFLICRFDPLVPIFRLGGSTFMVLSGIGLLLVGMFVGRPYCRFLCPYGALLRLAGCVSKWRVIIAPDDCKKCRLCEESCPYDAILEPTAALEPPVSGPSRGRLALWIALTPVLMLLGGWLGSHLTVPLSKIHPTVDLAEHYSGHQIKPVQAPPQTAPILSLQRAELNSQELLATAQQIRQRFGLGGWLFGGWVGLVIGVRLISLAVQGLRTDYEPDRGACVACARCFVSCPREQLRLKRLSTPAPAKPVTVPSSS